jgi:flagellar basal-body rod protein FlgC
MNAASLRLSVAARNIANAESTGALPGAVTPAGPEAPKPYVPLRVDQVEISGGTAARVTPASTEAVPVHAPAAPYADENGMVGTPDVDMAHELVQAVVAKYTYAANALVMRAGAQMQRGVLDITR